MEEQVVNICVGGTFSPLHSGHLELLREAFRRGRRVWVGLTSDEMAKRGRKRLVESFVCRKAVLENVLLGLSRERSVPYTIMEINDRYGFATMPEIDSIVVSEETECTVDEIDEVRSRKGIPRLKRFVIGMVTDSNGVGISSTRVASGEIDLEGNPLNGPSGKGMKGGLKGDV